MDLSLHASKFYADSCDVFMRTCSDFNLTMYLSIKYCTMQIQQSIFEVTHI